MHTRKFISRMWMLWSGNYRAPQLYRKSPNLQPLLLPWQLRRVGGIHPRQPPPRSFCLAPFRTWCEVIMSPLKERLGSSGFCPSSCIRVCWEGLTVLGDSDSGDLSVNPTGHWSRAGREQPDGHKSEMKIKAPPPTLKITLPLLHTHTHTQWTLYILHPSSSSS